MYGKLSAKKNTIFFLIAPSVLIFVMCCIVPLIIAFYYSLFDWGGGINKFYIGIENYIELLHDKAFWAAFKNNIVFVIFSVIGQIGIAFIMALLLSSRKVYIKKFHIMSMFFPVILSSIVVAYLWQIIYNKDYGLLNFALRGLGLENWIHAWLDDPNIVVRASAAPKIWQWIGYYMIILLGAISSVDSGILECAELDGASGWKKSIYIVLPIIKNTLIVTIILCISGNMKTFDQIYAMTGGGPGTSSTVIALYAYKMSFVRQRYGYGSACAIGILILSLLLVALSKILGGKKNKNEY